MSNQYIDILKNNNIDIKKKSIYPIYKVSYSNGAIIRFTDENRGICIKSSRSGLTKEGKHSIGWVNHYRENH